MHARDDDHVFADHAIEDSVRKPPNETPPSVSVSDGMCGGVHLDRAQRTPYRVEDLVAQPDLLLLVPPVRRLDIRSRGGPEDQDHLELRIRRTTSSHGIPVGASCSRSSSRRSSSVRCASVRGTASGVSHRLSQSSTHDACLSDSQAIGHIADGKCRDLLGDWADRVGRRPASCGTSRPTARASATHTDSLSRRGRISRRCFFSTLPRCRRSLVVTSTDGHGDRPSLEPGARFSSTSIRSVTRGASRPNSRWLPWKSSSPRSSWRGCQSYPPGAYSPCCSAPASPKSAEGAATDSWRTPMAGPLHGRFIGHPGDTLASTPRNQIKTGKFPDTGTGAGP